MININKKCNIEMFLDSYYLLCKEETFQKCRDVICECRLNVSLLSDKNLVELF